MADETKAQPSFQPDDDGTAEAQAAKGWGTIAKAALDDGRFPADNEDRPIEPTGDLMDVLPMEKLPLAGAALVGKAALAGKALAGGKIAGLAAAAMGGLKNVSKETLPDIAKKSFSIFTAENPANKALTAEENSGLLKKLYKELDDRGIDYFKGKGSYGPTPENPVIIPHNSPADQYVIESLAKKYGQESVIHKVGDTNKLVYLSGDKAGKYATGTGMNVDKALKENFTQLGSNKFNLNIDPEKLNSSELVHYSRYPEPLEKISPDFYGSGTKGAESARGEIIPRSYYYESDAHPEELVTQGAKHVYRIEKPSNIVDLASDEVRPFIEKAKAAGENSGDALNHLERMLKEAGFDGYKNTNSSMPEVVALFKEQKPKSVEPMSPEHYQKLRDKLVKSKSEASTKKGYAEGGEVTPTAAESSAPTGYQAGTQVYDISGKQPVLGTLDHEEVTQAIASGKYTFPQGKPIPVISPDGEHGTLDPAEAPQAFQAGYRYATPHDLMEAKFGTMGQQALSFAEGAGEGLAGPIATGAESALSALGVPGISAEERLARRDVNPVSHGLGVGVGLVAPALATLGGSAAARGALGLTQAGMLTKAGEAAAAAVGLSQPTTAIAKIGSAAVKGLVENAVFQGSDEVSKLVLGDPAQSVQTAITDIGLSGVIGGVFGAGFGAISPLWNATLGKKTDGILKAVANKLGGIEGDIPDELQKALETSGLRLTPEIKAGLYQDPQIKQMFKTLEQSDTTASGLEFQKAFKQFRGEAGEALAGAMGRGRSEVEALENLSKYESGKSIGSTLAAEYKSQVEPLTEAYEAWKARAKNVGLAPDIEIPGKPKVPGVTSDLTDKIAQLAQDQGWATSPSSDIMQEVSRVSKELPLQKTVQNLSDYIARIYDNTNRDPLNGPLRRAGAMMAEILKQAEGDIIAKYTTETAGAEALTAFQAARKAFGAQAALKEALDSRLHIGGATSSYGKRIMEMARTDGESLLRRLSGVNDADLLNVLKASYPKTAELIKNHHINDLLAKAAMGAKEGELLSSKKLLNSVAKLQPELRDFILPTQSQAKMAAVEKILGEYEKTPHNFSNTARTIDKLFAYVPATAMGLGTALTGHSLATAGLIGAITKPIGRDAPDAVRLGLLKFLGTDKAIDHEGFKTMVDFIHHTIKGETTMVKAAKEVFKGGKLVIPQGIMPTDGDRKRLNKYLDALNKDPSPLMNVGGKTAHYLPDHGSAIAQTATTAVQYLNSIKPRAMQTSPFDKPVEPSGADTRAFDRQLDIAQQPLMVLQHIKDGTIIPEDVATLQNCYPGLYAKLSQKLIEQVTNVMSKEDGAVPYQTRISLSMFLAQPLDGTMTPEAIIAAQPKQPQQPDQGAGQQAPNGGGKLTQGAASGMAKLSKTYATPGQAAEARKAMKA